MSVNKIIIFTMVTCGACKYLKKKLKENNIEFLDIDIDKYTDLWNKVVEQTDNDYVPKVYIINEDGEEGIILSPGRDFEDAEDLLKKLSNI